MLDIGAGDGNVTKQFENFFEEIHCTGKKKKILDYTQKKKQNKSVI